MRKRKILMKKNLRMLTAKINAANFRRMTRTKKRILDNIIVGDLLHYCPLDLDPKYHDIGIIYEIYGDSVLFYKIYWSRSQMNDLFSETTLIRKLKEFCKIIKNV